MGEVEKQLKGVNKKISNVNKSNTNRRNTGAGEGDINNSNNNQRNEEGRFDFDFRLQRSEAVDREMKKLKDNLHKNG